MLSEVIGGTDVRNWFRFACVFLSMAIVWFINPYVNEVYSGKYINL